MDGEFLSRPAAAGVLDLYEPAVRRLPLVFASPHSGAEYPGDFVAASRLDPLALRQSEDSFVDELFAARPAARRPAALGPLSAGLSRRQPGSLRARPDDVL
jgi:N-formylglutamate deformylase